MNKIESLVYNCVRRNPFVKQIVRNIYQSVFDLLPRKHDYIPSGFSYKEGYFFGFHDVTPFSKDETKVLANELSFDFRMPKAWESIHVGYFDFQGGELCQFHRIGESFAWNYHKGCRLQWLDAERIIYNTAEEGTLCSVIYSIQNGKSQTIKFPIDAVFVSDNEEVGTSFSYERLERCMPGYGYPYSDNGFVEEMAPGSTGLFLVDLMKNSRELIVSCADLVKLVGDEYRTGYLHFVTHSEFSKDGRYISFLYRCIPQKGDYMKRHTLIVICDRETKELSVLPSQESGSHYVWNSKNQIIASCIIDGHSCQMLFDVPCKQSGVMVAGEILNSDGHQSFINDESFITDTYPDKRRMAKIYKAKVGSESVELLTSVYSPKKFQTKDFKCHIACDLHPRVSPSGEYFSYDSPRTGIRSIYVQKMK